MEELYNLILTKLNTDRPSYEYDGNFLFRFWNDQFQLLEAISGKLVVESVEKNPVSILIADPVPFSETNKRIDWTLQYGILVRIAGNEYNATTDLDYDHIKTVCATLNGTVETSETKKYSFKVSPPSKSGYQVIGKHKYLMLVMTMNVTEITTGEFCQESVFTLTDPDLSESITLDPKELQISLSRRFHTADDKTDADGRDYNSSEGMVQLFVLTLDYDSTDNVHYSLFKETRGQNASGKYFTLVETTTHVLSTEPTVYQTFTYKLIARSANEVYGRNKLRTLVLEFVEAEW